MRVLQSIPLLDLTADVAVLASAFVASGKIPQKAANDAVHIAIAAVHGMDFLVTWNCVHVANATMGTSAPSSARQRRWWSNRAVSKDPIVEEVRRTREAQAARHGFDINAILSAAKKRQRRSGRRVVSLVSKNRKLSG